MNTDRFYPRYVEARLVEALADTPVVLIHGPRQCGKTTLTRMAGDPRGFTYFNFDDGVVLAAAQADRFRGGPSRPDHPRRGAAGARAFPALKITVDRRRIPGRFLLTSSANVLLVPRLAESLAGRMEILRLHPLAQCELTRRIPRFLDALLQRGNIL